MDGSPLFCWIRHFESSSAQHAVILYVAQNIDYLPPRSCYAETVVFFFCLVVCRRTVFDQRRVDHTSKSNVMKNFLFNSTG